MIKLYPVLIANSVSKNIIPGILKSVERFALIYKLDELSRSARRSAGISLKKVGNKIVIKESDDEIVAYLANEILQEQYPPYDPRQRYGPGTKGGARNQSQPPRGSPSQTGRFSYQGSTGPDAEQQDTATAKGRGGIAGSRLEEPPARLSPKQKDMWYRWKAEKDAERMAGSKERGKEQARQASSPQDASVSIGQMDTKSIMLEPTWMKIDRVTKYGAKFSSVLGVKAVPVPVKSDASLAQLLTFDKQVGRLMHLTLKMGRFVSGKLYRLYAKTIQRLIDPDPDAVSGDPYKDIVLKRTILADANVKDVFLVLNQADLDEDFAIDAKGIRKLMSLGWQSFCIADDVNRRLTFCMSEFRGMCHTLPYMMIYQSLDQAKVFEDLEDVRRSSSSLFKKKLPMKKVFGEALAQQKLEEFSFDLFGPLSQPTQEFLNEVSYIDENFGAAMKKVLTAPKQFLTRFFKGNVKVPTVTMDRALKIGKKIDPQFVRAFALAKRVISNSIKEDINEKQLDWTAMTVVIKAKTLPGKDLMAKTKDVLLTIVPMVRRGVRKAKQTTMNIPPQHRVEAVFGLLGIFTLITVIGFLYTWTLIASFKIKPYAGEAIKTMTEFISWGFLKVKTFILSTTYVDSPDLVKFWKKVYTDAKIDLDKMVDPYVEKFNKFLGTKTGEGGALENLEDTLKSEYDLSFAEIGALALLAVVGLYAFRFVMRPPK